MTRTAVPVALADLHRELEVDAQIEVRPPPNSGDAAALAQLAIGGGFEPNADCTRLTRLWTLPDYVAPDLTLLICGLNPSPASADSGVGFHRAGNRFWPAALAAGLVSQDRDPMHALTQHAVGMTDLVKRTTRKAAELDRSEYQAGVGRVSALVEWLQPKAICMVGLAGWRAAVDRKAQRGWQPKGLGSRPVYLMPSTSGLNAHDTVESLTEHLRQAAARN